MDDGGKICQGRWLQKEEEDCGGTQCAGIGGNVGLT